MARATGYKLQFRPVTGGAWTDAPGHPVFTTKDSAYAIGMRLASSHRGIYAYRIHANTPKPATKVTA